MTQHRSHLCQNMYVSSSELLSWGRGLQRTEDEDLARRRSERVSVHIVVAMGILVDREVLQAWRDISRARVKHLGVLVRRGLLEYRGLVLRLQLGNRLSESLAVLPKELFQGCAKPCQSEESQCQQEANCSLRGPSSDNLPRAFANASRRCAALGV